ncbi:PBECR2 nuclease fold domain-containing protein, partial [Campylobacter upsaliensis]
EITDLEKHKGYGLAHILDKRKSEFVEQGASESEAAQKAAEFAKNEISNIMQNGKIINKANEATRIETQDYRLILKQNWKGEPTKNKWLVTAYMKKEKGESISSSPFTKEDNLSLNSNESIAQNALSADEAISILQSVQAKQVPKELDIEGFLKELESVENKENFISHLSKKEDAKSRLAYLNLVKPTLEEADLILKTKNKNDEPTKEFIKAFQDENKRFFYIVITEQDNEKKLLTAFKTNKLRELKNRIEKARDFGEISFAHRFIKKSPTAENILKQKSLNLTEKLYLKDNDTPLNVEYKIVNKDDIKPSFTLSKTQFRSQKQEDLIKKIKENFNPDLLVNIRGDLKKGNPIITKEGEVISGNHRAAALKELEGENLAKYQNAVKEAFGVELKENEMLVRVADTSEAEIRRFSAASNEGLENNLGEQGVSLFAKYQDKIKALKEAKKPFVADDVYNLKYLVNKALGETSITKENDTSKALFASLARGRNNTILKALNELEKENLEQVSKVANMFFDNAGAFYNLTHDLDLPKMQNLQNYFSDVLVSAAKADFTRAEDFARLNEDIRAFLDSGDKNAMLKLSPNLVSDLLAKAMGAGFARFARLENPSASLYEFLNGLKAELIEKGMPDLFSGGKGIKLNERDEFDFAKELILKGQDSEEKFRLYQNLEELKAWKSKSSLNQPTKESLDKDLNKSYTLELENLEPVSLNANALSKETEALTQSVENGHKQSTTIAKTDEESIAQKAKNDEVLEAEVIEEVGLNEPMKFLEFQQRKLLTYIKENTPLRLLEHKKELKTRDILNFLEQSALNGKQKVFLMRNLERDFTKLKEDFKELESQSFKRDLLDKTKPLRKAEKEELTSEVLEQVQKENLKLYLNDTSGNLTKFLNAKKPFKITMRGANIKHILNRHGENSTLAKNGQPFVNLEDIKKYDEIINNADRQILKENDKGEKTLLSGKQINGHYIVISSVRLKNGELKLKTMYKENGKLENDKAFKSVKLPSETPSVLRGQSLTTDLDGYPSHADESIAQNSEKLPFEMQVLDEDKLSGDEVRLLANKISEKSTMAYFKDYLLKMDKNFHARAKDIIREYYKIEPFRKELENQWENVKAAYKNGEMSLKEFKFLSRYKDEKSFLNQVAGVLWLQNDELVKNRGYTINKYGLTEQGKGDNYYQNLALEYGKAQTALKKWFYYIEKANKQAQRFFNKKELEDLRANEKAQKEKSSWSVKRQEAKGSEDIIFTDKKGKEHTLTKETQKAWLEAFNLKSLEEAYIPNFKAEVKEAINRVLGGEEIKLTKGSFEKLLKRDREEFLPYIKDTLEKADLIIKDKENALIFVKDIGKKSYFTSVAKNANNEWVISTNSLKTLNTLKNRVDDNGEVLYLSKEAPNILAEAFTKRAFSNELAKDIIPQKANLEAVNKQKDKEFLEAYEKADFKGKVELAKQDINEEIKFLEKQKEEFERITQQKDYNDIELEQARKILENAKEEVEGHYRIKYMQNGKEMRAYISKTDYFNEGKILSKDEILHKIIQKTIYKDKIENIKKTSDKLKKQIKIIDEYLKEYGDNEAGAISDDIIEKFKYYNFAKDTGKGEIIIGERRKGLYEQAQKVLNSRFLKAKKRATQSKKNYNITYDEAKKLFYKGDMSEEQKELFQSVLPIAQKLNVRIRTAIREPYEDMIKDTTNIAGMYRYELNTATLKKGGNRTDTQRAETLLHELIHSVTSRAMSLYKTPLRDKMLSKTQIKAIDEIDQIYKKLYKFKKTFKLQDENGADLYGIKNSHEMLAELANPMFSSKLKEIGLYEKLVNNIMKIILSVRDFIRLRSDKNVYEKLKQCLKDIIENYKDDFTQEYEKQNIRDFTLTSQTQKEQIYTQRQELKSTLKAKINQAITNENTGEKAILTNKGISKMLSDKAISKSVDNGFSREEHLRAVGVVDELFKRAKRAFSKRDEKDKNLSIYRYNAPFKNANALMTLKEYKQNGKRIYSLELENLEAAKFNPSGKDLAEQLSKSKDADTTTFHTPIDNPDESIA